MPKLDLMLKLGLFFVLLVFYTFLTTIVTPISPVWAFSDDFSTDPRSNSNWAVQNETGLAFDNPGITLSSMNSSSFPYLKTSIANNLSSDRYYEIDFQFLMTGSPWGVGFSLTDNAPNFPTYFGTVNDYLNYNVVYIFGEKLHAVSALCPSDSLICPTSWWFIYPNSPPSGSYLSSPPPDYSRHKLSMIKTETTPGVYIYTVRLDQNIISVSKPTSRNVNAIWLGHPSNLSGPTNWPILRIYGIQSLTTVPSVFPYFAQKDPLWRDIEYDSASEWAPGRIGIGRWGCAITSVAMILKNYGIKDPSGAEATPEKLNEWLLGETDGYVRNGHLNWLAITRYAKESFNAGQSTTKLEFTRTSELPVTLPAIIGEPGHFVVAHASSSADLSINDPNDETRTTKLKTDPIVSSNIYTASSTDLSYFLFVTDPGMSLTLTDAGGGNILLNWISEYLNDDGGGAASDAVRMAMVRKPASGGYRLQTTGPGKLEIYLYDENGEVKKQELEPGAGTTTYEIDYERTNAGDSSVVELDTTKPAFVSTNVFSGWYIATPSAEFVYTDPNLRPDYVNPSCVIMSEGLDVTCNITPNVCDVSNNCNTDPQTSSVADVDWTPPTSNFSLPSLSNSWDGNVSGTASDNVSGVAKVELIIKRPNGSETTVTASGTENWSYTITDLVDGEYFIRSRATDTAGNTESVGESKKILVDTVAPTAPTKLWARGWWQRILLDWRGVADAEKYRVYWGDKRNQLSNIQEVSESNWVSGQVKQGQYYVAIASIDRAGNESPLSPIIKVEVHKKWDWRKWRWVD